MTMLPISISNELNRGKRNHKAETIQRNMSPLTDLDMHDQFAKPQLNGAALLKNIYTCISPCHL